MVDLGSLLLNFLHLNDTLLVSYHILSNYARKNWHKPILQVV